MKREILFRGKKLSSAKNFVYGAYLFDKRGSKEHVIIDSKGVYHPIIPRTVGQFIGVVDEKGNKVFEGDIVYYEIEEIYDEVVFSEPCDFTLRMNSFDVIDGVIVDWDGVVGNVYDNPNLLEKNNCSFLF
jgi:hypothetical protein